MICIHLYLLFSSVCVCVHLWNERERTVDKQYVAVRIQPAEGTLDFFGSCPCKLNFMCVCVCTPVNLCIINYTFLL